MDEKKPETLTQDEIEAGTVGTSATGKRLLSPDIVKRMKDAGLPKPEDVKLNTWNQVQSVEPGPHTLVAHLAACGLRPAQIAEATGLAATTVKKYLDSEKIKFEVRVLQHRYFGADPQRRFKALTEEATEVTTEIMRDQNIKPSVRLMAAGNILDRSMGKPKQHFTVEGSLIRRVYEAMDGKKVEELPIIDVPAADAPRVAEAIPTGENPNTVEKRDEEKNPNSGRWSGWVDQNL
jgi:predicted transcriptional regulator